MGYHVMCIDCWLEMWVYIQWQSWAYSLITIIQVYGITNQYWVNLVIVQKLYSGACFEKFRLPISSTFALSIL